MTEQTKNTQKEDRIRIADEVIATIAGIAASEVEDVVSMSGNIGDGIAGMLGKKNMTKGIKVELGEKDVALDLSIVVRYGCKVHHVAKNIQDKVRAVVEDMTGMNVVEVNVNVLGVQLENKNKNTASDNDEKKNAE